MAQFDSSNIKRIFVAEDDPDFFYFFNSAILSSLSTPVDVLRTADGVMFHTLIESSTKPDVIFLDLNMPLKNGISCLKAIRSNEIYKLTKVVICSSSDFIEDIDNCYLNGADFYFIKPGCFSTLVQQFKKLFGSHYFINDSRPPRENFVLNHLNPA